MRKWYATDNDYEYFLKEEDDLKVVLIVKLYGQPTDNLWFHTYASARRWLTKEHYFKGKLLLQND